MTIQEKYEVEWTAEALEMLEGIPRNIAKKIVNKVENYLAIDPHQKGKRLVGKEWKGFWSFKYWPYRVIYQIVDHELLIVVLEVWHRKENY